MKTPNLIISGMQGSGKGTQARLLTQAFSHYIHISSGALCRWHIEHNTSYKKEVLIINQGHFVKNSTIIKILEDKISQIYPNTPFILDGFPRNIEQAEYLLKKYPIAGVIHLDLNKQIAIQRTKKRLGENTIRLDDLNKDALNKRIQLYDMHNTLLLQLYKEKNILYRFSSEFSTDVIHKNIVKTLQHQKILSTT